MPVRERILETPSGKIHYWISRAETSEKWLVFLPGLTADHHLFDRQMEYFAGRCNCLVWDAPAHGKSRPFELNFTMDDMARRLHEILRQEQVQAPVLVGQSLGGYVAQVYMELYPGEAEGFISIDSCSLKRKYYTSWELWLLKRTKWMYLSFPWKLLKACAVMGTSVTAYGRSIMRRTVDSYEKKEYCALSDHGMRIFAEAVEAERTYEISCPVLLICGEKDFAGSAKRYNRRWTREEGRPLVWIPKAGHNANTDAPEEVNRLIQDCISGDWLH